jgi:N-formylglutamate deformylase
MSVVTVERGEAPLLVSIPHSGTEIPSSIMPRLVSRDLALKDTDWRVDDLYAFTRDLGATLVRTALSRTAIDVNRDPSGASLYPGLATTGLVPAETFDGEPLYREDSRPDDAEIAERRVRWFEPYHAALAGEIERLKAAHPRIVLYDCHSIRSVVPRLFEGCLPVFNIGTNGGSSCDPSLAAAIAAICEASGESTVIDGRFKGGWITRHYGAPESGVHAMQMELAQRLYLDEARPEQADPARAALAERVLRDAIGATLAWVGT